MKFKLVICTMLLLMSQICFAIMTDKTFQTAKDWALVGEKKESGAYWYIVTRMKDGKEEHYGVVYRPQDKYVGGTVEFEGITNVIMFDEKDGSYTKASYIGLQCIKEENVTQKEADIVMNDILDHLIIKKF